MGSDRKTTQLTVKQNSHMSKCKSVPGQHSCHVGERQGLQEDINVLQCYHWWKSLLTSLV